MNVDKWMPTVNPRRSLKKIDLAERIIPENELKTNVDPILVTIPRKTCGSNALRFETNIRL